MRRGSTETSIICGVDEAGRGPLAGPVVAAAVILDSSRPIKGLKDSKLLSPVQRAKLYSEIIYNAADYAIAGVHCDMIDKINILQASLLAMRKAVQRLGITPDKIYVDGNFIIPELDLPQEAVIGGDRLIESVSAASILAKVARDTYMIRMAAKYPGYGFERHKGYGTREHQQALAELGPCPIHRRTFNPVAQYTIWN
jgi:ribonuclease HII